MPDGPPGLPAAGGGGADTRPRGTAIYDPPEPGFGHKAVNIWVSRHDGSPLPNVRLLDVQRREFLPPVAHFEYVFGSTTNSSVHDPFRVHHCFALDAQGHRVARLDDRLRASRWIPDYGPRVVFDGFLVAPQADLGERVERVGFTAIGTPVREWDTPIPGAVWRDSDGLDAPGADDDRDPERPQDVRTDLPARFNPDGRANATPEGADSGGPGEGYPVFADPLLYRLGAKAREWTLPMAVRYLCRVGCNGKYVKLGGVGGLASLDRLMTAVVPADGYDFVDPTRPETFVEEDILVPDIDVTGMAWPDAVRRLIEPHGFAFEFHLETAEGGSPEWYLRFYSKLDASNRRSLYHQRPPAALVPGRTNVAAMSLVRDCAGIENHWKVATEPVRYEASLVLAPDFEVYEPDEEEKASYVRGFDEAAFDPVSYRTFVFDEDGSGHWDFEAGEMRFAATSLREVLQPGAKAEGSASPFVADSSDAEPRTYVRRRRPPYGELISVDGQGKPRRAELWVSTNYPAKPGVWDPEAKVAFGTKGGDWQLVGSDGWRLLDDRLGIYLTAHNPDGFNIGQAGSKAAKEVDPFPDCILNVVKCLNGPVATAAEPRPSFPRFCFRLTVAFQGDRDLRAEARRRNASPTRFDVLRYDDARDRFRKHVISPRSHVAAALGRKAETAAIDDTARAKSHAGSRRRVNESGSFAGIVTIGHYTESYRVGDKPTKVEGRAIDLAMNAGREQGEAPVFPVIVSVDTTFSPAQQVVIQFQDYRAEPPSGRRRRRS